MAQADSAGKRGRPQPAAFVALRFLSGRRGDGRGQSHNYLRGAVASVALSLVPLVIVLVVADSMIQGITARYLETSTYPLQATPLYWHSAEELSSSAAALENSADAKRAGLVGAFPEIQGPGIAVSAGGAKAQGIVIRAIDPRLLSEAGFARYLQPKSGALKLGTGNEVLLGEALARKLGAQTGDLITIATAAAGSSSSSLIPKIAAFRVKGIVSSGYRELDSLWAIVPLRSGAHMLAPSASRSFIGIKVKAPFGGLEPIRTAAGACLRNGQDSWTLATWGEAESNLWRSFSTTRALLLLIMTLTVAVAAVNVGSALVMLVLERRKDLAILKTAGAGSGELAMIFIFAGGTTGLLGTLIGLALGCLLSWRVNDIIAGLEWIANAFVRLFALLTGGAQPETVKILNPSYYLEYIPVSIEPGEILITGLVSIGLCILASALAARRAARLSPLELLRKV